MRMVAFGVQSGALHVFIVVALLMNLLGYLLVLSILHSNENQTCEELTAKKNTAKELCYFLAVSSYPCILVDVVPSHTRLLRDDN